MFRPRRSLLTKKEPNGDEADDRMNGKASADSVKEEEGAEKKEEEVKERSFGLAGLPKGAADLDEDTVHQLRQHELFLSRQTDTLQATTIRGKCNVVMLNEVETCDSYLSREDAFFYSLVYDASNHTLLADKGKIEVGERHQAEIPELLPQQRIDEERGLKAREAGDAGDEAEERENGALMVDEEGDEQQQQQEAHHSGAQGRKRRHSQTCNGVYETRCEQVVYHPHHKLTDRDIDQFLIIARQVKLTD